MGESNHFLQPRENFLSSLKVLLAFISLVSCVTVWNVLLYCLKKNIQSPESTKLFLLNPSLLPWHLKELLSHLIWFRSFSNPGVKTSCSQSLARQTKSHCKCKDFYLLVLGTPGFNPLLKQRTHTCTWRQIPITRTGLQTQRILLTITLCSTWYWYLNPGNFPNQ